MNLQKEVKQYVNLSLCLIMHLELKAYGGGEIELHTFLAWARDGGM